MSNLIAQSWERSREAGVVPDRSNPPRLEFIEDLDLRRRLVQCASPVLDRLHDDLSGMSLSVALTDEHAQVMLRRDNDPALAARLDRVCFAPGFSYPEEVIGTNGVGTALEVGAAVYVDGRQHFHEAIVDFTCAGAPIHNPITGRVEGLIDITSLASEANPLMRHLALGAARDIESALRATGSAKQQLVLGEFLATCRRRHAAVYSLSCGVFMSNTSGSRLLDPIDEAFLREEAHTLLSPSRVTHLTLDLPSGATIAVKRKIVEDGPEVAGVVLEVEHSARAVRHVAVDRGMPALPGVVGHSAQWTRCSRELMSCAANDANALLRGESGTGKTALARGAHLHRNPQAPVATVDCDDPQGLGSRAVDAVSSSATTIIFRHIDRLTADDDATLADLVSTDQRTYPARWIVATSSSSGDLLTSILARQFSTTIDLPALRHHPDDIPEIVRMHMRQIAPQREDDVTDDAMRILKKYHWPGNTAELVDVVKDGLRSTPAGRIGAAALPAALSSAPRRTMTAMEGAERDAIVAALRECAGNRVKAAKLLGISRSSLYRKMDSFGIQF
ncbi:sigma-54-dependent Fis family transcriptional regulator [Gordonia sp. NPDC003376]